MKRIFFLPVLITLITVLCVSCSPKTEKQIEHDNTDPRLTELNGLIDTDPDNHVLWHKRALLYLEMQMPYEALSDVNKALQLDPQNTVYTITLGDIYFSMGHIENCRKALISAQDNDPTNTEPILKLAELDLILKDYEKMNLYLNKVLELDKTNAQVYFMRGVAQKEQGDSINALRNLHRATTYDPEYYKAFVEAGILASEMSNPIAEEYLNTALNLRPASIEARYARAMYFQNHQMLNEAMQEYYNILAIDKKNPNAHFNLGFIHLVDLQLYSQAVVHFSDAIASNPNYAEAYYNRGYSFELLGDVEAARRDYREALSLKTNYSKAIDGLNRLDRFIVVQ